MRPLARHLQHRFGQANGLLDGGACHANHQIALLQHGTEGPAANVDPPGPLTFQHAVLQVPTASFAQPPQAVVIEAGHQGQIHVAANCVGQQLDQPQQQLQVLFQFRSAAAGQQTDAWRAAGRRGGRCEHRIHERIAQEGHRPLQLSAEVFGGALIAAVHRFEAAAFQQVCAGPGEPQRPFVVAGVGHQVGRHRPLAEPCRDHRDHISHHQDQIKATPVPHQTHQASEQIQHLPLGDLGEAAAKAGVADAAGAEFMAASQQRHAGFLVGAAKAHQRKSLHVVALLLKLLGQQGAGEVFTVAIAQQQDACHRRAAPHHIQVLGSGMPLARLASCNRRASLARRSCRN